MNYKLFELLALVGFVSAFNAEIRPDASSRWVLEDTQNHKEHFLKSRLLPLH